MNMLLKSKRKAVLASLVCFILGLGTGIHLSSEKSVYAVSVGYAKELKVELGKTLSNLLDALGGNESEKADTGVKSGGP